MVFAWRSLGLRSSALSKPARVAARELREVSSNLRLWSSAVSEEYRGGATATFRVARSMPRDECRAPSAMAGSAMANWFVWARAEWIACVTADSSSGPGGFCKSYHLLLLTQLLNSKGDANLVFRIAHPFVATVQDTKGGEKLHAVRAGAG